MSSAPAPSPGHCRLDSRQPFTVAEWLAAGRPIRPLRNGSHRRVLRGVYVAATSHLTPGLWARAALKATPAASFVTHHTAARLFGAVVPDSVSVHVGTTSARTGSVAGVVVHRYAAPPPTTLQGGVRVTTAVQTFLDLAAVLDLVDLVALGDSLVFLGQVSLDDLRTAAAGHRGRGARSARRAASFVRARVESGMESRVRMLFVLAGLPEPTVNVSVSARGGRLRYRIDLAWEQVRVAVEYDGRHHIARQDQWQHDIDRREALEAEGWRFVVLTSRDVYQTPGRTIERTVAALTAAGLPGLGPVKNEWRRHFPDRSAVA